MDFIDWNMVDHISTVGTFIIALLTYFKGKNKPLAPALKSVKRY